jgi:hypothetical protein
MAGLFDPLAIRDLTFANRVFVWPVQYLPVGPKGAQPRVPADLKSFEACFEEQDAIPEQ